MTSKPGLPFGQTQIKVEEYASLVDRTEAENLLAKNGVNEPADQMEQFIAVCPAMLKWLEEHGRHFPWRATDDPWRVYATEILLQRTRAAAVEEIYDAFFEQYPTPQALHEGNTETLRDLVRPLGFVNHRTRSLSEAAEMCVEQFGGNVPESLEALKQPWRVGNYSARACLLFAFDQVQPLVDTNFSRVISRVLGYEMPTQPHKSDTVYKLLKTLVPDDPSVARAFNLAILDIGALVCDPDRPRCASCPLSGGCTFAQRDPEI